MEFRSPAPQKGLGKDLEAAAGLLCAEQEMILACAYTESPLHNSQTPKPVGGQLGMGPTCATFGRPAPMYPACHSWHQLGHL